MITLFTSMFEEMIGSIDNEMPIFFTIFMEAFVSLHMTAFVFNPFSEIFFPKYPRITTITLFAIRLSVLIILDFIIPGIAMFDFFFVFIGAFAVFPIFMIKSIIVSVKNKGEPGKADDKKLTRDEIPKYRRVISIVYGIIGALILPSAFILYKSLPTIISLTSLTGFYIYLYVFYPKKHAYKEPNKVESRNLDYVLYILIILLSSLLFINPRIIYECDKNECKVVKYIEGIKKEKEVNIPSKYNKKPVTGIGKLAFYDNDNITKVDIPKTVSHIESKAFVNCDNIEYLEIGEDTTLDENSISDNIEIIKK